VLGRSTTTRPFLVTLLSEMNWYSENLCKTEFKEFALITEEIEMSQCEKMKFRNAWPR
jgi:hypothetical protein